MIRISKITFLSKNLSFRILHRMSDFKNSQQINNYLQPLKELTSENLKEIKNILNTEKKIHIFQVFSITKFLFIGTRLQVLVYGSGTLAYSFYALYYKYYKIYYHKKTERARIMRIKLISAFILVLLSSAFGLSLTFGLGKRIVKSIFYLPKEEIFEINYFNLMCFDKTVKVPLKNIKKLEKKRRFDSTIQYEILDHPKYKLFSTRGTGLWLNKHLMEIILKGI